MSIAFKLAITFAIMYVPCHAVAKANCGFNDEANIAALLMAALALLGTLVGVWTL